MAEVTHVSGQKTVTTAGTRVALVATRTLARYLYIKPLPANTNNIYVGDVTVTSSTGFVLDNGDVTGWRWVGPPEGGVDFIDLNKIYIDSAVNGEGVSFIYTK